MSKVLLKIDDREVEAKEGMTILEAAQKAGIDIPTLCHHEILEPYGACRFCIVEIEKRGRVSLVASCLYPVENDLIVRTRSEEVNEIRKMILEFSLAHAPDAKGLENYAKEYGANKDRFEKESSFCIHCGLCVRYCAEVKKKNAIGFINRGTKREIYFVPEIASKECWDCKECFPLCPTEFLQATYVLNMSLLFSSTFFEDKE
ncbi:MAG: 2Fe-2S iron-sulfur cluster-binding protein [Dethiobacteria bacterium]|jgi:bidirectional [NiFe] hydrogenase diaphorase subunit